MKAGLKIKVCGMREADNLAELIALRPDYVGYIFYLKSSRYVGSEPDRKIFDLVPDGIEKVGVFVNEAIDELLDLVEGYGIGTVQLHGDESTEYCCKLKSEGLRIIKAISSDKIGDEILLDSYNGVVDFFLFDTAGKQYGGSGKQYDWSVLSNLKTKVPWFLSGGLSAEDAEAILEMDYQGMFGLDVNSRFELRPGLKDVKLVGGFIEELRNGR